MEQKRLAFSLPALTTLVLSIALLIPGISQPFISFRADIQRQALVTEGNRLLTEQSLHPAIKSMAQQFLGNLQVAGSFQVYDKTRSILRAASDLWHSGFKLVAILILTFSLIIPLLKALLLLLSCHSQWHKSAILINSMLGKWSMADVFAMGVFIAMLAANGSVEGHSLLSFHAELHPGFYWFLSYCLLANIAGTWLLKSIKPIS